jgi:hypothetical protein
MLIARSIAGVYRLVINIKYIKVDKLDSKPQTLAQCTIPWAQM